jgi:hypothetical protein
MVMADAVSEVRVVHALPGRTRLRVVGPRLDDAPARELAEALAQVGGVLHVTINRRTGSVLCEHESTTAGDTLRARAEEVLTAAGYLGRAAPAETRVIASGVARALSRFFSEANASVLRATDGRLDLGVLVSMGFVGMGAVEVAVKRELPAPPWFNLAWWGFRTFMTVEAPAVRRSEREAHANGGEQPTEGQ